MPGKAISGMILLSGVLPAPNLELDFWSVVSDRRYNICENPCNLWVNEL
jgi:hypothetical protein